jgi:hypothetical protein
MEGTGPLIFQALASLTLDVRLNFSKMTVDISAWQKIAKPRLRHVFLCHLAVGCCLSIFCSYCVSYHLRKRALYGDMSRYVCCNGDWPCSGRCGEQNAPQCCLCMVRQIPLLFYSTTSRLPYLRGVMKTTQYYAGSRIMFSSKRCINEVDASG